MRVGPWVLGFGFWVLGFGFWVLGSGFWAVGLWVLGLGFWVLGFELKVSVIGSWVLGFGFRVLQRVLGLGLLHRVFYRPGLKFWLSFCHKIWSSFCLEGSLTSIVCGYSLKLEAL